MSRLNDETILSMIDQGRDPRIIAALIIEGGLAELAESNASIAHAIENYRTDHPLQGETLNGLESGLNSVAESIQNGAAMLDLMGQAIKRIEVGLNDHAVHLGKELGR